MNALQAIEIARRMASKNVECDSTFKHMCSEDNKKSQKCQKCNFTYCSYHIKINNSYFGQGGHICPDT